MEQRGKTRTRARTESREDQRNGGKRTEKGIKEVDERPRWRGEEEQRGGTARLRGTEKGCQGR